MAQAGVWRWRTSPTLPAVSRAPFIRSKLFVPGTRPERFAKAMSSGADAVSYDLEDAVAPAAKAQARAHVAAALAAATGGAFAIVRINPPGTPWFEDDLRAVACEGTGWINLPKVESPETVQAVARLLEALEAAHGIASPIGLLVNVETPRALRRAAELGMADPRVAGLQLGLGDLFEPHGIQRRHRANVHAAQFALAMAAAEAGVAAFDGAWPDITDAAGLQAEAEAARALGYAGKSCIHPAQVAAVNAAFTPGADEVAAARRIVAAAEGAADGVVVVDGRMVDAPYVARARALLDAADAAPRG